MRREDSFSKLNPWINFIFYIGVILLGMIIVHPAFLVCALILSCAYYLSIMGKSGIRFLALMVPLFVLLSVLNPLINTYGEHVLFTYFGRPYTMEALLYGIAISAMFTSVLIWFASYNRVMTSDKFIYIFGRLAPGISLVLSMILRLVPNFKRKAKEINSARKCIGKSVKTDKKQDAIKEGAKTLSGLTSWALEGGIITSDSMQARGYGAGKRTSFAIYRFTKEDIFALAYMIVFIATIIVSLSLGGMRAVYTPEIEITGFENPYTILGFVSYLLLGAFPTILNIKEALTWRILRSKI